jgi:hypothetical protein
VLAKKAVDGGVNLHNTAGAVPKTIYGLVVSVPPEILAVVPKPLDPALDQSVVKVIAVDPAFF